MPLKSIEIWLNKVLIILLSREKFMFEFQDIISKRIVDNFAKTDFKGPAVSVIVCYCKYIKWRKKDGS